jgi:CRP/FNR family transcriptional regulator, cyclic AMP receptor protein
LHPPLTLTCARSVGVHAQKRYIRPCMIETAKLQACSLFGGLSAEQIDVIRTCMTFAAFNPGDIIMREGEPNDSIYFMYEGKVEVSRRGTFLVELPEGQTFGEMELLDIMPSAATVTALTSVKVATISNTCVRTIYAKEPKVFGIMMMNLARDLSRRLRRMDELACDTPDRGGRLDESLARGTKPVFG